MLDKKKILIAVGLLIIVAALVAGGYYLLKNKDEARAPAGTDKQIDQEGGQLPGGGEPGGEITPSTEPTAPVSAKDSAQIEAGNTAKFFVEMLGSYSSDARFQNVIDLKPMMTAKMQAWADDLIRRNAASLEGSKESITTQVFTTKVKSWTRCLWRIL